MAHVLFHRPTVWASDIQCSTKVLAKLTAARGHQVTYLQAPLDPAHLLRGRKGYFDTWRQSPHTENGVKVITPLSLVPVRDLWPLSTLLAARFRYRFALPPLQLAVGLPQPDLIWTTVPGSAFEMRRSFPASRIVFHVVDFYPAFRGRAVRALEQDDYSMADAVLTISQTLRDYVVKDLGISGDKVAVLGQGVEVERFHSPPPSPKFIADLPRPRAVWSGLLSKGDPELFCALACELRRLGGSLVLIGPPAGWAEELATRLPDTVHLVGSVTPSELPSWIAGCDVGVMLYDRSRPAVYRGQNPLKLYEYAASGLPVLSTPHEEYAHLSPPVLVISGERDIPAALERALRDAAILRCESIEFARKHSWQNQVTKLLELLSGVETK